MENSRIDTNSIVTTKQLTKENLEKIFKKYFLDDDIFIETNEENDTGVGAHYQSDIMKLDVKLNKFDHPLKLIVKEPVGGFISKVSGKFSRQFARETFWYAEAYPVLSELRPELENFSPKCYHAYSNLKGNYM